MRCELKIPAINGDVIPLCLVAEGMAKENMKNQHSTHLTETKYCTLQDAADLLNNKYPLGQVTKKDLFHCAALKRFRIYSPYDGDLLIKFDPFSDNAGNTSTYSYSGYLEILDYKYGAERDWGFLTFEVLPKDSLNLVPNKGSTTVGEITNYGNYYFSPHFNPSTDNKSRFPYDGTEVFDIYIDSSDLQTAFSSITSLKNAIEKKQKEEGRYTLEDAAAIIAEKSNSTPHEIEQLLFSSIKGRYLDAYINNGMIPISDLSKFNLIESALLYELYWDSLNDWLEKKIPRLAFKFQDPQSSAKPETDIDITTASKITKNKLRRNTLDPAIDKAIEQAGSIKLADVYLKLKDLALDEEKPFTGAVEGDALCYTNDKNQPVKLSKNALEKRLRNRH
jgi:hypothetical protein